MKAERVPWPVLAILLGALIMAAFEVILQMTNPHLWKGVYTARGVLLVIALVGAGWTMIEKWKHLNDEIATRQMIFFNNTSDGIVVCDEVGLIVYANKAALGMFKRESLEGLPVTVLIPEDLIPAHNTGWIRYYNTGKGAIIGKKVAIFGRRSDGEVFPITLNLTPAGDGVRRFYALIRDETQAYQALQRLMTDLVIPPAPGSQEAPASESKEVG